MVRTESGSERVFISYSRQDGAAAAARLRARLEAEDFTIWQDVAALEGGRDWWSQIEDAIRAPSVEHLVLVVSDGALSRPVIRQEVRLARQEGVRVTPVRASDDLDLGDLPRWLGHVLDANNIPEHWTRLKQTLEGTSQQNRVAMMAPEPPEDFVERRTIAVSLDLLDDDRRARFGELAVFPEDADVPIGIAARLWAESGGLDEYDAEDLLTELFDLSLLLNLDLERRTLRFHDTVRQFLQDRIGKDGLIAQHQRLIHAMGDIGGAKETPAAEAQYFYLHLPHHLSAAGDRETLDALLLDPGWLRAKFEATRSPQALVADYEQHSHGQMQSLIGRTLRLTAGILARDERQLLPQLLGRLIACEDARGFEILR